MQTIRKRNAPKNIAVVIATSEQIEGQYNNVQIGDPQFDTVTRRRCFLLFQRARSQRTLEERQIGLDTKLFMYDSNGQEVKFVPGQLWVEVLEPGQALKWEPTP